MIPELGHISAILAMHLAGISAFLGFLGASRDDERLMKALPLLSAGQWTFCLLSFLILVSCFLMDDFSVAYVASNSNSLLPWYYKVSATWGAHEGSFLLWILIMASWTLAVTIRTRALPLVFASRVIAIMSLLNLGFLAFLVFTSNPFERLLPLTPIDGKDLNPLLQDIGLIIHPPILYMGYVGFSVAFSFAIGALLSGRIDSAWAKWCRPWSNLAWAFLTIGITLGSWWAYYELGWGGWWFWDPVENASFMPWLVGTALIHSLAISEKRSMMKGWSILLAIMTFSLCLLGAFIVRSGILTSVHSFAVDPERGIYILAFLLLVVGGSLLLYGRRSYITISRGSFKLYSREAFVLSNNILFVSAMGLVLLGTLYPLAYEVVTGGDKISVGLPYFNTTFIPLMGLVAILLGLIPLIGWKETNVRSSARIFLWAVLISLVAGMIFIFLTTGTVMEFGVLAFVFLGAFIFTTHLRDGVLRVRKQGLRIPWAYWGMSLAHSGFAILIIAIALNSTSSIQKDARMHSGEKLSIGNRTFEFLGVTEHRGANYVADRAAFRVKEGRNYYWMYPEKRRYFSGGNVMTEAAIEGAVRRDIYITLGEPMDSGDWTVRLQIKPFVRLIWVGSLLLAFGGIISAIDRRYRKSSSSRSLEYTSGAL